MAGGIDEHELHGLLAGSARCSAAAILAAGRVHGVGAYRPPLETSPLGASDAVRLKDKRDRYT